MPLDRLIPASHDGYARKYPRQSPMQLLDLQAELSSSLPSAGGALITLLSFGLALAVTFLFLNRRADR